MFNNTDFFSIFITIIAGLGWGSFATMAVYRIPRGMPWIGDKPRCLMCKHELNMIDYFSIISYFIWRGSCRYCKGKFECNLGYFFTELLITVGFVFCYMKYNFGDMFVLLTSLIVICTVIGVVDSEHKKIPAKFLLTLLLLGAVYRTFMDQTFYGALYGGIGGFITGLAIRHLYFLFKGRKEEGFDYTKWQHNDRFIGPGFDYVKLLAIIGVFLPFSHFGIFLLDIGSVCYLWYSFHKRSFRLGSIMSCGLVLYTMYPEMINSSLGLLEILGFKG